MCTAPKRSRPTSEVRDECLSPRVRPAREPIRRPTIRRLKSAEGQSTAVVPLATVGEARTSEVDKDRHQEDHQVQDGHDGGTPKGKSARYGRNYDTVPIDVIGCLWDPQGGKYGRSLEPVPF